MTTIAEDNLIGFYASFMAHSTDQELIKNYVWGFNGLKERLKFIKWYNYGQDLHLILFEFYIKPIPYLRDNLREIGSYRRKEKSIGIPVIVDELNFFNLCESDRQQFFTDTILIRLDLVKEKVKRNKLDLDVIRLNEDVFKFLSDK